MCLHAVTVLPLRVPIIHPDLAIMLLPIQKCESSIAIQSLHLQACLFRSSGFDRLFVPELNTDHADMESVERQIDGRILGFTGCSPAASELANEMSLAIEKGPTVRDVARSLHSYPSHGYLMHRVALALPFKSIWGQLEACGPVGGFLANFGRLLSKISSSVRAIVGRRRRKLLLEWEAEGVGETVLVNGLPEGYRYCEDSVLANDSLRVVSFLDAYENVELREQLLRHQPDKARADGFKTWLARRP
jgi:hypothetical protein